MEGHGDFGESWLTREVSKPARKDVAGFFSSSAWNQMSFRVPRRALKVAPDATVNVLAVASAHGELL